MKCYVLLWGRGALVALLVCASSAPVMADELEIPTPKVQRVSLEELTRKCQGGAAKGDASACAEAGLRWQDGDGVKADTAKAAGLFKRACDLGSHVGCADLAALMLDGDGVTKDVAGAAKLLEASCKARYGRACAGLGTLADKGTWPAGKPQPARARAYYQKACDMGSGWGCGLLAYALVTGAKPDFPGARKAARKGCKTDKSPAACSLFGKLALGGKGGPKAPAKAARALLTGCQGGRTDACRLLAHIYAKGIGVKKDPAIASRVLKAACEAKDWSACNALGQMCVKGDGIPIDYGCARARFRKACTNGVGAACTNMGLMHVKGLRVSKSTRSAARYYQQGCKAGHEKGCKALADLCKQGEKTACKK